MDKAESTVIEPRNESIDILRGIVMVLMALDHTRDFFTNIHYDPLDLSQTDIPLFITRWITHYCAPVFIFLAGTGAFLSFTRGKTKNQISWFLFTRGIWLIFLEITIIRFCWVFNFDYSFIFVQVIWAIGWSMVVLSVLIYLPIKIIAVAGISLIIIHNAFDGIAPEQFGGFNWLWVILHNNGILNPLPDFNLYVQYPLIPWIGVMAAGYSFGSIVLKNEKERNKIFILLGSGMILLFIILRAVNIYGDPDKWIIYDSFWKSALSFIDSEKYPPSLLYILMTLGPAILSLAFLNKISGWLRKALNIFGRVPLFFYILHILVIHLFAALAAIIIGLNPGFMFSNVPPWEWPAEWGFSLPFIYLFWIIIILLLYPSCKWFYNLKKEKKDWKLSYF